MSHKYLILIDDNSQQEDLKRIKHILKNEDIDLTYQEYDPKNFQKREANGDVSFDKDGFVNAINSLAYIKYVDSIVCDYNLIENVVNGFDIIKILKEINPHYKKQIILYSAEIKTVINDIVNKNDDPVANLQQLIACNIDFTAKAASGYEEKVIKHIKKEKPFNFEDELIKWFYDRQDDEFNYLFPKYQGKKFSEIAQCLESKIPESAKFKEELVGQIVAYLSKINGLQ